MPGRKQQPRSERLNRHTGRLFNGSTVWLLLGIILIVIAAGVAYWPALHGGFVLDDDLLLTENHLVQASDGLYRIWFTSQATDYWPVTNSTLWLEWRLWGRNTTGYHVVNLALHVADCLLIWLLLRKLAIPGAFLAALLFAVHPVNVESVAWIAQLKNVLSMLFFLLSILWYLNFDTPTAPQNPRQSKTTPQTFRTLFWYALSLAAFVLAMLSKGSVAILPLVLLLIVWWQRDRVTWRDVLRLVPFFLVAVGLTAVNIWFQAHTVEGVIRNATFLQRLLGAGAVVWFYLWKAILPLDLSFVYPQWTIEPGNLLWWLPLAAAIAVTMFLVWQRNSPRMKWVRPVLFAWAFFCVALAPVMGFTDVTYMRNSLVADHYQYIALLGVVALISAGVVCGSRRLAPFPHHAINIAVGCAVGALLIVTRQQTGLYANAMMLYTSTAQLNPNSDLIQLNLGVEHYKAGEISNAIEHFQAALRIDPANDSAHMDLGTALINLGRFDDAIQQFQEVLRLKPSSAAMAHCSIGIALTKAGRPREAIEHLQQALEINPNHLEACNNLAWILATTSDNALRDPNRAVQLAQKAIELDPQGVDFFNTLGVAHYRAGHWQEALQWLNKSTQATHGGSAFDWFFLAMAHQQLGQHDKALSDYDKAVERMDKTAPQDPELLRFRAEAQTLLAGKSPPDENSKEHQ
jgi:tetratricopeptide (TPR) repeat protein